MEDAEGEEGETDSKKPSSGLTTPGFQKSIPVPPVPLLSVVTKPSILSRCYPFSYSSTVPFLPSGRIEDCLPPCYREQAKYMSKLIKVSVSVSFGVLFHVAFCSSVYPPFNVFMSREFSGVYPSRHFQKCFECKD